MNGTSFRGLNIVIVTEAGLRQECSPAQRMRMLNNIAVCSSPTFNKKSVVINISQTLNKRK
jgi:hypothetical protein